jgi:cytidine deaminase
VYNSDSGGHTTPNATPEEIGSLLREAAQAREHAHAPFSGYKVGAALLVESERLGRRVFKGCNVEGETFTPTMCAERVALGSAIAAGAEPGSLVAVAVVAGPAEGGGASPPASPCGVCRQILFELSGGRLRVVSEGVGGSERKSWTIADLLPDAFINRV